MNPTYHLADPTTVASPSLLFYEELIQANIAAVIQLAGSPLHLRPHVKTHKTVEIAALHVAAGVTKHKCATLAEAEVLALAGVPDVLVAYPTVGPNVARFAALRQHYTTSTFSTLVDHPTAIEPLAKSADLAQPLGVFIDVNLGMDRTGCAVNDVLHLCRLVHEQQSLQFRGLHCYDGHVKAVETEVRHTQVAQHLEVVVALREQLEAAGYTVPSIICGGTPNFPAYAKERSLAGLEYSPGTYVLQDHGYGSKYTDLAPFQAAALLLTRVISKPTPNRLTFDCGTKALSADQPLENRVRLLNLPDAKFVGHNEEHLVVETPYAQDYLPGDVFYAMPGHICPTVALYDEALIVSGGAIVGTWAIRGRQRKLSFE